MRQATGDDAEGASVRPSTAVPLTPTLSSFSLQLFLQTVHSSRTLSFTLSGHIIIIYYRPYPYHYYLPNDMQSCTWPQQQQQQQQSGECRAVPIETNLQSAGAADTITLIRLHCLFTIFSYITSRTRAITAAEQYRRGSFARPVFS